MFSAFLSLFLYLKNKYIRISKPQKASKSGFFACKSIVFNQNIWFSICFKRF
jgi:hypothetical protein